MYVKYTSKEMKAVLMFSTFTTYVHHWSPLERYQDTSRIVPRWNNTHIVDDDNAGSHRRAPLPYNAMFIQQRDPSPVREAITTALCKDSPLQT